MPILFATRNNNKVREVQQILFESPIRFETLADIGFEGDIPEDQDTIEGNALHKATFAYERWGMTTIAEDTGLIVPSLGGLPGVHTARFAGEARDDDANMAKMLSMMSEIEDRSAYFMTIIAYKSGEETRLFQGTLKGTIAHEKKGTHGFGYDPIFIPSGQSKTLAEMTTSQKNEISHRQEACSQLAVFLKEKSPKR